MFKIEWHQRDGKRHDIGGPPMFAPPPVATIAGDYVVKHILPKVRRKHPEVWGFALLDFPAAGRYSTGERRSGREP